MTDVRRSDHLEKLVGRGGLARRGYRGLESGRWLGFGWGWEGRPEYVEEGQRPPTGKKKRRARPLAVGASFGSEQHSETVDFVLNAYRRSRKMHTPAGTLSTD